jgi:AraC family transcriptional regulator
MAKPDKFGAYGSRMAEICRLDHARTVVSRSIRQPNMAVTEIRADRPSTEKSAAPPREDAFIVAVSFVEGLEREGWLNNRPLPSEPRHAAGTVSFLDLRHVNHVRFTSRIHSIQFYFPLLSLNKQFSRAEIGQLDSLTPQLGKGLRDATLLQLASCMRFAFREPETINRTFLDHVQLAAMAHVLATYAGTPPPEANGNGLAPWQLKRATEMMAGDLAGPPLEELARACRLSTRHFARAFKQSTGLPPHQWMLRRRIESAQALLRGTNLPLADIALRSAFASQSHLTRVFTAQVGVSPGAWRRARD